MITGKVIREIYKKYSKPLHSNSGLYMDLLNDISAVHDLKINNDYLIIGSVGEKSPFYSLPLKKIYGIVNFENCIAIVLHSSILFLDKNENKVQIHLKMKKPNLFQRLIMYFNGNK